MPRALFIAVLVIASAAPSTRATEANKASLVEFEQTLRSSAFFDTSEGSARDTAADTSRRWHGLRMYGGTSMASVEEVVDIGRRRSYNQAAATVGLQLPLLGSRLHLDEEQQERDLAALSSRLDTETRRRRALSELRRAYIDLWSAQQRAGLADRFLADQSAAEQMLQQRTGAGLLLESDRLEFMSAFLRAQVELRGAQAAQHTALDRIGLLLHEQPLPIPLARPQLDHVCRLNAEGISAHPELQWLGAAAAAAKSSPRASTVYPWRSDLRVSYARSHEPDSGQSGGAGVVSWSFDYPIGEGDQWRADRARARLQAARASDDYTQRLATLQNEIRRLVAQESLARAGLQFAQAAYAAGEVKVQERQLRAGRLAGDVAEQLLQARYALYRSAVAQLDAEASLYAVQNEWTVLAPSDCRAQSSVAGRGLYLWSSERFVDALQRGEATILLQRLARARIDHVYLSLDAAQLAAAARNAQALRTALSEAQRTGITVDLLLGEPTWMLPEQRAALLATLKRMRSLPFAAIHLDLEPNQLDAAGGEGLAYLPDLLATLRAVRAQSAQPLGLSLHARYLSASVEGRALAEHLQTLGIDPTLMIYAANPQRVLALATPLLERWPQLRVHVALSLETELDATESLARLPAAERERRIAQIETGLAGHNFAGVVIQTSKNWLYEPEQDRNTP